MTHPERFYIAADESRGYLGWSVRPDMIEGTVEYVRADLADTTLLCAVLADIRAVTGVGMKPMLGELAGAIKASQADAVRNAKLVAYADAERAWKAAQFSPAPYVDGCANLRKMIADVDAHQEEGEG